MTRHDTRLSITGKGSDISDYDIRLNDVPISPVELRLHLDGKGGQAKITFDVDEITFDGDTKAALEVLMRHKKRR